MKRNNSVPKDKLKAIGWAFKLVWKMDKKVLLLWICLSAALSLLPAFALYFNREIVTYLSDFLAQRTGSYDDIIAPIIALGMIMTFIGLSARVNADLIYMMMYDSYYVGMQEVLMDSLQKVQITDLLKSEINDEYRFIVGRAGSLTDFMSSVCAIFGKLISLTSLAVVSFTLSKTVFAFTLIYITLILVFNLTFTQKMRANTQKRRRDERRAAYFEKLPQNTGIAKEIRIYQNMEMIIKQWSDVFEHVRAYKKQLYLDTEIRNLVGGLGFFCFLIVIVITSLQGVAKGDITPGEFVVLYTLCINIYTVLSGFARNLISFDDGLFGLQKQYRFFHRAPFTGQPLQLYGKAGTGEEHPVFEVKQLTFGYRTDFPVIKNLTFSVRQGEIVALVGKNGSGKTTLSKLLLGMYTPTAGSIKLYGKDYSEYSSEDIRSRIGVFFQDFYLFHTTFSENVAYGDLERREDQEAIKEAARKGGAWKVLAKLPNGLNTVIGKAVDRQGVELSGGEKQRIAVARSHMSNKKVLIFDEPAAALDPIAEMEQFMDIRQKLNGRTAILISHRIGFARLADKIIMMADGEIAETGTHEELMALKGQYANFFAQQAQWYESVNSAEVL
jgi:ATP-binding cassette subfamily B protein